MSSYQLTITPLKLDNIPSEESILTAGREILESTKSWKQGKSYHRNTVKTFTHPKGPEDGAPWHCRVSEHTAEDATFDEFWSKLGNDKAVNEKEFIPSIKKVTLVKTISPAQSIWTLYYTFPPPVSPRVFTVLQTIHLDQTSPRTGIIVSIPVDVADDAELAKLEEKGVRARYASVERLQEVDGGKVHWQMATSSTPGGMIPPFIAEMSIDGQISADVPHFIKWLHRIRSKPATTADSPQQAEESAPGTSEPAVVDNAVGA